MNISRQGDCQLNINIWIISKSLPKFFWKDLQNDILVSPQNSISSIIFWIKFCLSQIVAAMWKNFVFLSIRAIQSWWALWAQQIYCSMHAVASDLEEYFLQPLIIIQGRNHQFTLDILQILNCLPSRKDSIFIYIRFPSFNFLI